MLKSVVSQNMANPSMFHLPNIVQYLPIFIYSSENFLVSNFIKPADLFHFSPCAHFRGFKSLKCSSVWGNVHVSAAYSAALQTKYFIILFFSSRFTLLVNNCLNLLFSIHTFFTYLRSQFCSEYLLCNIHSLIWSYLNIWIGSFVPIVVHQHKSSIYHFPFVLYTSPY